MKRYNYFICYFGFIGNTQKIGNCQLEKEKIKSIFDIAELEKLIKLEFDFDNVVITNFKKLGVFNEDK